MRSSFRAWSAGLGLLCAGAAIAQTVAVSRAPAPAVQDQQAVTPATGPAHVQYDQLVIYLADGAPAPSPQAFEQEYAKVRSQMPPPPVSSVEVEAMMAKEMAASKADEIKMEFADWSRGTAESLLGTALSAIRVPLVGNIAGYAADRTIGKAEVKTRQRELKELQHRSDQRQAEAAQQMALQSLRSSTAALQRVSIWGTWVRIDNPLDHTAIVYKPDLHRYLVMDNAHKLYRIIGGPPPQSSPIGCDADELSSPLGPSTLGGVPVHGYRTTLSRNLDGETIANTLTTYRWDRALPPQVLAVATGHAPCPPDSPVGRVSPGNHLILYELIGASRIKSASTAPDEQLVRAVEKQLGRPLNDRERTALAKSNAQEVTESADDPGIVIVRMRGHLRMLPDADRALFEPPAGYRRIQ